MRGPTAGPALTATRTPRPTRRFSRRGKNWCKELLRKNAGILERVEKRGPRPIKEIEEDRIKNVPLIHEDTTRRSNPGNRCKLDPIFILQMCMIREYKSMEEWELGDLFGVDQSAISWYLRMGNRVLKEMLPAPAKFVEQIRDMTTPRKFAVLFPEGDVTTTILIDGTHVTFASPMDPAGRKAMYNGKQKECAENSLCACGQNDNRIGRHHRETQTLHCGHARVPALQACRL